MRVVRSLADLSEPVPSVVTIGNFDGVHRGHQAILAVVRERASKGHMRSVAITFEPHPLTFLAPGRAPTPIATLEEKVRLIENAGIDILLIQEFTEEFSRLSAEAFIERYLVAGFQARVLCVGRNFRFGHRHCGDVATLRAAGPRFDVVEVPTVTAGGRPVSSSRIRERVRDGGVGEARRLLGRCYELEGTILSGTGRHRRLTLPGLDLKPVSTLLPGGGVYLTRTGGEDGAFAESLTSIGPRPAFGETQRTIETYLLDTVLQADAGRVRIRFIARLRNEQKFESVAALDGQIGDDRKQARRFFRRAAGARGNRLARSARKAK